MSDVTDVIKCRMNVCSKETQLTLFSHMLRRPTENFSFLQKVDVVQRTNFWKLGTHVFLNVLFLLWKMHSEKFHIHTRKDVRKPRKVLNNSRLKF